MEELTSVAGFSFKSILRKRRKRVVYLAMNENRYAHAVVEPMDSGDLKNEINCLRKLEGIDGIPKVIWTGIVKEFRVLLIEALGPTLHVLHKICDRQFSYKTVLCLAYQMINLIEAVHSKDLVHRNVCPQSFRMGLGSEENNLFMSNFRNCKLYRAHNHDNGNGHIPYREDVDPVGSPRFLSLRTNYLIEHTRRDDLESLALTLIYFFKGDLPWKDSIKEHGYPELSLNRLAQDKCRTDISQLCRGLPDEMEKFLTKTRTLQFFEPPNYAFFRSLIRSMYIKHVFTSVHHYDWTLRNISLTPYTGTETNLPYAGSSTRSNEKRPEAGNLESNLDKDKSTPNVEYEVEMSIEDLIQELTKAGEEFDTDIENLIHEANRNSQF